MSDIDEIKRRLNIVDVIGEYLPLQKSGANFRARCPFHVEKTPSFFVSPDKEIWHCFGGCQKGGDIFAFLMEMEHVDFGEALRILAKRAGVPLRQFTREDTSKRSLIFRINELASLFFQKALTTTEGGKKAQSYLHKRGVSEESIERFKLGYAPSSWRSISTFLEERGYKGDDCVASGLVIQQEGGRVYDRFRARLMFPIQNALGQVVGFTGRTLSENTQEAKYINTPQTLVYDKSGVLYGIYQAKSAVKEKDEVLLVEGNLDVILSSQAGIEQVVATSGTALTQRHLSLIRRYSKNLIFCFDSDQAGVDASKRAFLMALKEDFDVSTLIITQGKDPGEVVRAKGKEAWLSIYSKKQPIIEFLWENAGKAYPLDTVKGKRAFITELFHFIEAMPNNIERSHWLSIIAQRLNIREEDMHEEFQKFKEVDKGISKFYNQDDKRVIDKQDRFSRDKENLTAILLAYPHLKDIASPLGVLSESQGGEVSPQELLLKAEVLWPTEGMAKRELVRIVNHLRFLEKKKAIVKTINHG